MARGADSRSAAARQPELSSAFRLPNDEMERRLACDRHCKALESYFGPAEYGELRRLAREAAACKVRGGPRVLILPGMMGSTLGRRARLLNHVLWLDPVAIARGKLTQLALGSPSRLVALGVMLFAYLKLKLRLALAGFDAAFFPYDWRQSIDTLGQQLADRIENEPAAQVSLVGHSMGGLVARAAAARGAKKIRRVVLLGTPNYGSFAAVQALRGTYPVIRKIAWLDCKHNAAELAGQVFNTFPSIYQLLPSPDRFQAVNLFESRTWRCESSAGRRRGNAGPGLPVPLQPLLDEARDTQRLLAPADERFFVIAGVDQETVTGLSVEGGQFVYQVSREGDGTVPVQFAELPGAKSLFIAESHGSLPNNRLVAHAAAGLLRDGQTSVLADHWLPTAASAGQRLVEAGSGRDKASRRDGKIPQAWEVQEAVTELVSAKAHGDSGGNSPGAGIEKPARNDSRSRRTLPGEGPGPGVLARRGGREAVAIVIGRKRQSRIDLNLACGDITQVNAGAYVLGIFQDVAPGGAAKSIDGRLNGAIADFSRRRMISGQAGQVFILPAPRHSLRAAYVLLVGLGPFDRFGAEAQKLAGEHVIRTLIPAGVDEFAAVLPGAGSGWPVARSLENLLAGVMRGLRSTDAQHRFRGVTLCEKDRRRYAEMKRELLRLAGTDLFEGVEVTLNEIPCPGGDVQGRLTGQGGEQRRVKSAYLIVRQEQEGDGSLMFCSSVLGGADRATVISGARKAGKTELERALKGTGARDFNEQRLEALGTGLARLLFDDAVTAVLRELRSSRLVVVHDAAASRIPWECLRIGGWFPAACEGLTRKYSAENLPVARWFEQRAEEPGLNILLVVNPTGDLPGAEAEGARLRSLFESHGAIEIRELRGKQASRDALLEAFCSGRHDVVHYAGHAFFNPQAPGRSGIVCHGGEVLGGADLAALGNLPSLVFFNACEAGRIRRRGSSGTRAQPVKHFLPKSAGLAEAFLRGGLANFVGTYWPVGDASAASFAAAFYGALLKGTPLGSAILAGRRAVRRLKSADWANYMHYGAWEFVMKRNQAEGPEGRWGQ